MLCLFQDRSYHGWEVGETRLDLQGEAIVRAGINPKGVEFHALRNTCAAWAADTGATTAQLMALLGWRSVRMAEQDLHRESLDLSSVVAEIGRGSSVTSGTSLCPGEFA